MWGGAAGRCGDQSDGLGRRKAQVKGKVKMGPGSRARCALVQDDGIWWRDRSVVLGARDVGGGNAEPTARCATAHPTL
jgi:hypothetical protein